MSTLQDSQPNPRSRRRLQHSDLPRNHHGHPVAPLDPAGHPYQYCWHDTDRLELVYAATAADLLDEWIPGYLELDEPQRMYARAQHAISVRTGLVAQLAATATNLTGDQERVLLADLSSLPDIDRWNSPVPLVLLDALYRPYTDRQAPISGIDGDVRDPSNILWLRTASADSYVQSLAHAGVVQLDVHD